MFLSAVMQMGLALPMAYYFHRATTLGLPANLLVVPLTQLLMPAAISALALGAVWVWLAKIPVLLTTLALHGIMGTVRGTGRYADGGLAGSGPLGSGDDAGELQRLGSPCGVLAATAPIALHGLGSDSGGFRRSCGHGAFTADSAGSAGTYFHRCRGRRLKPVD